MSSFEAFPGVWLHGKPVPDDPSELMYECTGSFVYVASVLGKTTILLNLDGRDYWRLLKLSSSGSLPRVVNSADCQFLANLMLMVIVMIFLAWTPILNNSVCQLNSVSNLPTAYGNSDFPTTSQASNISTSTWKYASPNGNQAVKAARESSIPVKTKNQTDWTVRLWADWAAARNQTLLPESPFSCLFCELTVSEIDFWLSRSARLMGIHTLPPNSLSTCLRTTMPSTWARTCRY